VALVCRTVLARLLVELEKDLHGEDLTLCCFQFQLELDMETGSSADLEWPEYLNFEKQATAADSIEPLVRNSVQDLAEAGFAVKLLEEFEHID
jgi:hypothetical protein